MFSIKAPDAKKVAVAGSFNNWDTGSHLLNGPDKSGFWEIVVPLPKGDYEYLFLVDDKQWLPDPAAFSTDDGLGGKNSVIKVSE